MDLQEKTENKSLTKIGEFIHTVGFCEVIFVSHFKKRYADLHPFYFTFLACFADKVLNCYGLIVG